MTELSLNCWLWRGTVIHRDIFNVDISSSKNVTALKKALIQMLKLGQDQRLIALWQVNIPEEQFLRMAPTQLTLDENSELHGLWKLSRVFPTPPPDDRVHIIVKTREFWLL